MKKIFYVSLFFGCGVLRVMAQNEYALKYYSLQVLGTSTVHDWIVNSVKATGNAMLEINANTIKDIKSLMLAIPGDELKSEKKNKSMDQKIYEALKIESYLNITVKLKQVISFPTEKNGFSLSAIGVITIGGFSREENLTVQTKIGANGAVSFSGEKKLLMTDYNIKPPKAMMGMLKTGNEVTIKYELTMQKT